MSADYVPGVRRSSLFVSTLSASLVNESETPGAEAGATPRHRGYITGFRDTVIKHVDDDDDTGSELGERLQSARLEKNKLIVILVGLPGRGKTYLANKLRCYLNWLGHRSRHFNVGAYRRQVREDETDIQDANFFNPDNETGMRSRQQALDLALDDLTQWLVAEENNQVAVFDATNSTEERRRYLRSKFHGKFQYMFIESICNDEETLEKNYRLKMKYSPDYQGVDMEEMPQAVHAAAERQMPGPADYVDHGLAVTIRRQLVGLTTRCRTLAH